MIMQPTLPFSHAQSAEALRRLSERSEQFGPIAQHICSLDMPGRQQLETLMHRHVEVQLQSGLFTYTNAEALRDDREIIETNHHRRELLGLTLSNLVRAQERGRGFPVRLATGIAGDNLTKDVPEQPELGMFLYGFNTIMPRAGLSKMQQVESAKRTIKAATTWNEDHGYDTWIATTDGRDWSVWDLGEDIVGVNPALIRNLASGLTGRNLRALTESYAVIGCKETLAWDLTWELQASRAVIERRLPRNTYEKAQGEERETMQNELESLQFGVHVAYTDPLSVENHSGMSRKKAAEVAAGVLEQEMHAVAYVFPSSIVADVVERTARRQESWRSGIQAGQNLRFADPADQRLAERTINLLEEAGAQDVVMYHGRAISLEPFELGLTLARGIGADARAQRDTRNGKYVSPHGVTRRAAFTQYERVQQ